MKIGVGGFWPTITAQPLLLSRRDDVHPPGSLDRDLIHGDHALERCLDWIVGPCESWGTERKRGEIIKGSQVQGEPPGYSLDHTSGWFPWNWREKGAKIALSTVKQFFNRQLLPSILHDPSIIMIYRAHRACQITRKSGIYHENKRVRDESM